MKTSIFVKFRIAGLAFSIVVATSCITLRPVYFDDDKKLANEAVETFHKEYNEEDFETIAEMFTPSQQKALKKQKIIETMEDSFRESGIFLKKFKIDEKLAVQGSNRLISLRYRSLFKPGGIKIEEFVLVVDGNSARIEFYGQSDERISE